jgi:hypothetical protein
MTIAALTDEQRHAIERGGPPIRVMDQATHRSFYLLSEEQYEKVRLLLESADQIDPSLYEFTDVVMFNKPS